MTVKQNFGPITQGGLHLGIFEGISRAILGNFKALGSKALYFAYLMAYTVGLNKAQKAWLTRFSL